ncbi:hypothetical protein [Sinobaca sp. H24]|uniref:hypothetical protein n=1 Tax=Sinobaca sp. H24 TaxID=2923376 RepID=UPI002079FF6F|nr:hypothetical protein [Sinobaca sp. H24]
MELILALIVIVFALWFFNFLMGYRKKSISFTLEERHTGMTNIGKAAEKKLQEDGRDAVYIGNGLCRVDGSLYRLSERTVPMGGVPMQRIVLTIEKKASADEKIDLEPDK